MEIAFPDQQWYLGLILTATVVLTTINPHFGAKRTILTHIPNLNLQYIQLQCISLSNYSKNGNTA